MRSLIATAARNTVRNIVLALSGALLVLVGLAWDVWLNFRYWDLSELGILIHSPVAAMTGVAAVLLGGLLLALAR